MECHFCELLILAFVPGMLAFVPRIARIIVCANLVNERHLSHPVCPFVDLAVRLS